MKKVTVVAAWVLGVSLCVSAQDAGGPGGRGPHGGGGPGMLLKALQSVDKEAIFKGLDTDGDGAISKAEFEGADLSQVIGPEVQKAMRAAFAEGQDRADGARGKSAFEKWDKNGDGKVSAEEHPRKEVFEKILQNADTDGDGLLSQEEFDAFRAKRAEAGKDGKEGRGRKE